MSSVIGGAGGLNQPGSGLFGAGWRRFVWKESWIRSNLCGSLRRQVRLLTTSSTRNRPRYLQSNFFAGLAVSRLCVLSSTISSTRYIEVGNLFALVYFSQSAQAKIIFVLSKSIISSIFVAKLVPSYIYNYKCFNIIVIVESSRLKLIQGQQLWFTKKGVILVELLTTFQAENSAIGNYSSQLSQAKLMYCQRYCNIKAIAFSDQLSVSQQQAVNKSTQICSLQQIDFQN